jgi:hypothetical protein
VGVLLERPEAVTLWTALDTHTYDGGFIDLPQDADRRQAPLHKARQAPGPARTRAAEQHGAAMTLAAAEFVTMHATGARKTMPGWQITLIATGAAVIVAVVAVLLDRTRAARRGITARAA